MRKWIVGLLSAGLCVASALATDYTLVTSATDLTAGDYVILAEQNDYAMTTANANSKFVAENGTFSIVNNVISDPPSTLVWTLAGTGTDNQFTVGSADGYITKLSSNTAIGYGSDGSVDAAKWNASITDGIVSLQSVSVTDRYLQRHTTETTLSFGSYKYAVNLRLFKAGASGPSVSGPATLSVEPNTETTATYTLSDATATAWAATYGTITDGDWSWTAPDTDGIYTNTITATYADGTATKTTVITVAAQYSITITPSENGTVTTTPSGTASEGSTVTITATANSGYAVGTISVVDSSSAPVAVTGTSFTMPASAVTVTVTFEVSIAPDALIDFEDYSGGYNYSVYTNAATGMEFVMTNAYPGTTAGSDRFFDSKSARMQANRGSGECYIEQQTDFAAPITKINYYAAWYGNDTAGTVELFVSDSSAATWTSLGTYAPAGTTLTEVVCETGIPANSTRLKVVCSAASGTPRVNVDNIGVWFGAAVYSVRITGLTEGAVVPLGTEISLTAEAQNGTGPYTYAWTGSFSGSGETLTIPSDTPIGDYSVTVTATDTGASSATTEKTLNFSVANIYAVTVATVAGGSVTATPESALEGATIALTVTPDEGYTLDSITASWSGGEVSIADNAFTMPAGDVTVTPVFRVVSDTAALPFIADGTPYSGPWKDAVVDGMTQDGLGSDYSNADGLGAKFDTTEDWLQIKFSGTPGEMTYGIKGNSLNATTVSIFSVQTSTDGAAWTDLVVYRTFENITNSMLRTTNALPADAQYVRFIYTEKGNGNIGLYDLYISGGSTDPTVTYTGATSVTAGGSFSLQFALSNYEEAYSWAVTSGEGSINASGLYTWANVAAGSYSITVAAVATDESTIASKTVALTVTNPPPGADTLVVTGPTTGTVSNEYSWTLSLASGTTIADCTTAAQAPDGTEVFFGGDLPTFTLSPLQTGTYVLTFTVTDPANVPAQTVNFVVTSGGGGGPVVPVSAVSISGGNLMLTLGSSGAGATVYGATGLTGTAWNWQVISDATITGTSVTVPMSATQQIIKIEQ